MATYAGEAKLKLTKKSKEEDLRIIREQILKWQKLLLQLESDSLITSGSRGSKHSQSIQNVSMTDAINSNRVESRYKPAESVLAHVEEGDAEGDADDNLDGAGEERAFLGAEHKPDDDPESSNRVVTFD